MLLSAWLAAWPLASFRPGHYKAQFFMVLFSVRKLENNFWSSQQSTTGHFNKALNPGYDRLDRADGRKVLGRSVAKHIGWGFVEM